QLEPWRHELAQLRQLRCAGGAAHLPAFFVELAIEGGGGAGEFHAPAAEGGHARVAAEFGAHLHVERARGTAARREPSGLATKARFRNDRPVAGECELR